MFSPHGLVLPVLIRHSFALCIGLSPDVGALTGVSTYRYPPFYVEQTVVPVASGVSV